MAQSLSIQGVDTLRMRALLHSHVLKKAQSHHVPARIQQVLNRRVNKILRNSSIV